MKIPHITPVDTSGMQYRAIEPECAPKKKSSSFGSRALLIGSSVLVPSALAMAYFLVFKKKPRVPIAEDIEPIVRTSASGTLSSGKSIVTDFCNDEKSNVTVLSPSGLVSRVVEFKDSKASRIFIFNEEEGVAALGEVRNISNGKVANRLKFLKGYSAPYELTKYKDKNPTEILKIDPVKNSVSSFEHMRMGPEDFDVYVMFFGGKPTGSLLNTDSYLASSLPPFKKSSAMSIDTCTKEGEFKKQEILQAIKNAGSNEKLLDEVRKSYFGITDEVREMGKTNWDLTKNKALRAHYLGHDVKFVEGVGWVR